MKNVEARKKWRWPHRRQPTRLPCPWDSPGKSTGVGCHFLLQCMKVKSANEVTQSCPTLRDPMDCSLPGSSITGFSRQEYWSVVPLPSPKAIILQYKKQKKKKYIYIYTSHLLLSYSLFRVAAVFEYIPYPAREVPAVPKLKFRRGSGNGSRDMDVFIPFPKSYWSHVCRVLV